CIVCAVGAFESPIVGSRLTRRQAPSLASIMCLGVILRGETAHAQHIAESVTQSLAQMQLQTGIPVIHEVLLLENESQAKVRCLSSEHNRGTEAAQTALEMRTVMRTLERGAAWA